MARLIDLHTDWLLQYATETTLYDPELYRASKARLRQAEGYLQTVSVAFLSCYRKAEDWASRVDAWSALAELITRIEAEFPGRLLIGPDDFRRWEADRHGLTWGVIGIEGFDALVRTEADLGYLRRLFERGVRLFQPVYGASSLLAGSSVQGDETRGLTDLGRRFLDVLEEVAPKTGPVPLLDLAHLNQKATAEVLAWFEADPTRSARLGLVYSHGGIAREGFDFPRMLSPDNLKRLRALGGFVGIGVTPPFCRTIDDVRRSVEIAADTPFLGAPGMRGIGIGTDFLGVDEVLPGLDDAPKVATWIEKTFPRPAARALTYGNALELLRRVSGIPGTAGG